jgi:hypothetical protein
MRESGSGPYRLSRDVNAGMDRRVFRFALVRVVIVVLDQIIELGFYLPLRDVAHASTEGVTASRTAPVTTSASPRRCAHPSERATPHPRRG